MHAFIHAWMSLSCLYVLISCGVRYVCVPRMFSCVCVCTYESTGNRTVVRFVLRFRSPIACMPLRLPKPESRQRTASEVPCVGGTCSPEPSDAEEYCYPAALLRSATVVFFTIDSIPCISLIVIEPRFVEVWRAALYRQEPSVSWPNLEMSAVMLRKFIHRLQVSRASRLGAGVLGSAGEVKP